MRTFLFWFWFCACWIIRFYAFMPIVGCLKYYLNHHAMEVCVSMRLFRSSSILIMLSVQATHSGLPADLDSTISSSSLINRSNDSSQRASWDTSSGARPLPPGGGEEGAERTAEVFAKRAARVRLLPSQTSSS